MGKLIDQDYLWIQAQPPQKTRSLTRLLPLVLIPLTAAAGWHLFGAGSGSRKALSSDNVSTVVYSNADADRGHSNHAGNPDKAVGRARLIPVNRMLITSPATDLDTQINALAHPKPATDSSPAPTSHAGWRIVRIRAGDTLSIAFNRHRLSYMDSLRIAHLPTYGDQFTRGLEGGDRLRVKADRRGRVLALDLPLDTLHTLEVRRHGDRFSAHEALLDVTRRRAYATGVIESSFYRNALASGLSDRQVLELNRIFSWDIDFGQDLRAGDRFAVVYDELYRHGKKVANGPILAAAFVNQDHEYRAIRYTDADGSSSYYNINGRPLRQAFVRAPVNYTRISSSFNLHRLHPILHRIRRHEGTDYAAPMGTPIHATGSGRIIFQGRRGGYGNMVIIRHDADITMRFGHMSSFSRHFGVGSQVKQGDVIGYVGMTGLATGPHVHYEFRVDGSPHNPQTVKLPGAPPLTGSRLARFKRHAAQLVARVDALSHTSIARVSNASGRASTD